MDKFQSAHSHKKIVTLISINVPENRINYQHEHGRERENFSQ